MIQKQPWLTRREGAERLRISERSLDRMIRAGRVKAYRLNYGIRLNVAELEALIS